MGPRAMTKCFWCDKEFTEPPEEITPMCSVECTEDFIEFWNGRNDIIKLNPEIEKIWSERKRIDFP
jgi:hypothetical protein